MSCFVLCFVYFRVLARLALDSGLRVLEPLRKLFQRSYERLQGGGFASFWGALTYPKVLDLQKRHFSPTAESFGVSAQIGSGRSGAALR